MKKIVLIIIGNVLLFPLFISDALGTDIDTYRENVYRPVNLPAGHTSQAGAETKIIEIVQFAINLVLYASGSAAVIMLIYGAIRYITSFGETEGIDAAKKILRYALIGLLAVLLAFAAVTNIIDLIYKATT